MTPYQRMFDYSDPSSLGSKLRRKRIALLENLIVQVSRDKGAVRILDVGGRESYWNVFSRDFLLENHVRIVLANLSKATQPLWPDVFEVAMGDGCALDYDDNEFDICHSNSVIEHVGSWDHKVAFAKEVSRVASIYWHQTPNFWFPWEPHYGLPLYHWLPEPLRLRIACGKSLAFWPRAENVGIGMNIVEHASLINERMFRFLFPDGRLIKEHFLGFTKSFTIYRS